MLVAEYIITAKIMGLAEQTKKFKINKKAAFSLRDETKGWRYSYYARELGIDTRYYFLARAFMRGVPYRVVESKTAENNLPCVKKILTIVQRHGGIIRPFPRNPKLKLLISEPDEKMTELINTWLTDQIYQPKPQPKRQKAPPELVEQWRNEKCRCGLPKMGHR